MLHMTQLETLYHDTQTTVNTINRRGWMHRTPAMEQPQASNRLPAHAERNVRRSPSAPQLCCA